MPSCPLSAVDVLTLAHYKLDLHRSRAMLTSAIHHKSRFAYSLCDSNPGQLPVPASLRTDEMERLLLNICQSARFGTFQRSHRKRLVTQTDFDCYVNPTVKHLFPGAVELFTKIVSDLCACARRIISLRSSNLSSQEASMNRDCVAWSVDVYSDIALKPGPI